MHSARPAGFCNPGVVPGANSRHASDLQVASSSSSLGSSQLGLLSGKPTPVLKNVSACMQGSPPRSCSTVPQAANDEMDLESSPNVSVKNRFSILSSFQRDLEASPAEEGPASLHPTKTGALSLNPGNLAASGHSSPVPKATGARPPPIYVQYFDGDLLKLSRSLEESYGKDFNLKFLGNRVRIQVFRVEDFNDLKSRLLSGNMAFHSFTINSQKVLVVVIKGLSRVPVEDILAEIKTHGLAPISCVRLNPGSRKNSQYCSYKVVFPQGTSLNAVNKIGHIFHTRIYWEKFQSQRPFTQCYRCQSFGHSSANCNHPPRCVKCAGSHYSRECVKTLEITRTCANCAGPHTANYSKCPALEKYLQSRNKQVLAPVVPAFTDANNNRLPTHSEFSGFPPPARKPGAKPSYRDALAGNLRCFAQVEEPGAPRSAYGDVAPVLKTLNICREIGSFCDLGQIQDAANRLLMKLRSCTTKAQQLTAFLEVAQFLD